METPEKPAHLPALFRGLEIRPAAPAARVNGKQEAIALMQGFAGAVRYRCDTRNFLFRQFQGKCVLLENRGAWPAAGAVKFCDHGLLVLDTNLVNTVFVAVQCQQSAITTKAGGLDCRKYEVR